MPKKTKKIQVKTSKEIPMLSEPEKLVNIKSKVTSINENAAQEIIDEIITNPPEKYIKKQTLTGTLSRKDFDKQELQENKIAAQKELEEKKKAKDLADEKAVKKKQNAKPGIFSKLRSMKIFDKEDSILVKKLFSYVLLYGLMLNFVSNVVFGFPITFYSWIGWGLFLWFIENKFIGFIRKLLIK